jgi:hypothetical protein
MKDSTTVMENIYFSFGIVFLKCCCIVCKIFPWDGLLAV